MLLTNLLAIQRTAIVHHCCCDWRKELSVSDIGTNSKISHQPFLRLRHRLIKNKNSGCLMFVVAGCSFWWNAFHYFWDPIVSYFC